MASGVFTGASFFFNLVLLALIMVLISVDMKKKDLQKYYAISFLLTAVIFIFSNAPLINSFLGFFSKASLSLYTTAFILVYVLAHVSGLVSIGIETLKEKK
tara:strand:+ start:514 stop:816 length:303 start_codon:yes stop_codon:yes gene_type:complete